MVFKGSENCTARRVRGRVFPGEGPCMSFSKQGKDMRDIIGAVDILSLIHI